MKNQKCTKTELVNRFINGELEPDKKQEMINHIKVCPICQEEYRILKETDNFLSFYIEEEPSEKLNNLIISKVTKNQKIGFIRLIPIAASFILAFVLGIYISNASLNDYTESYTTNLGADTFYSLLEGDEK